MSHKVRISKSTIIISLIVLLGLFGFLTFHMLDCNRRNTMIPESPTYPGSTLMNQSDNGPSTYRLVTQYFVTTASPDDVLEFYENNGAMCSRNHCSGQAKPSYADFTVLINAASRASYVNKGRTPYVIELRWRGCTNKIE